MERLRFYITNRFLLLMVAFVLFLLIQWVFSGSFLPTTETKDLWFYSGLFMVFFSVLFIEPYYTSPKNVITNSIPLLLVLVSVHQSFKSPVLWWILIGVVILLLLISIMAVAISRADESLESPNNVIAEYLKSFAVAVGQGKVLYSAVFLSVLFLYNTELISAISEGYFYTMIVLWGLVLLIDPKKLHNQFSPKLSTKEVDAVGEIFSVQSNRMFLIKMFNDKKHIGKFDVVQFTYSMDESSKSVHQGLVFETYNLNKEKWAKVLPLDHAREVERNYKSDVVYRITDKLQRQEAESEMRIDEFVGVVSAGSEIGVIKFDYSKKSNDIQEGDLLEATIGHKKVFYQVFGGFTVSETLENKNKSGFIEGEAIQLGMWNEHTTSFEKFGWVPEINTPLFKANTVDISVPVYELPFYQLGVIPGTALPSVINLDDAVSHHLALLGVTGAGKSFIAMELIRKLLINSKVIVIDFTGEWSNKLQELKPSKIIDKEGLARVQARIAEKETIATGRSPDKTALLALRNKIQEQLANHVDDFMKGDGNLGLFELPELSNTSFILEFTQLFFDAVFKYAKTSHGNKICLVLEEAHTIIPETNFLGDLGDYGSSKALVSKMSQIALQGRKYGVGLMVIAQRTANVSKTVLTQCNTIICFQAFDETSFTFLGNYIGKDLVQALPNLKKYHAIVTGKAMKANIPMIVNLEREVQSDNPEEKE